MYGYQGDFESVRVELTRHHAGAVYTPPPRNGWQRWRLGRRIRRGACGHVIWEFRAVKPGAAQPA
jgi:hypothetical protein